MTENFYLYRVLDELEKAMDDGLTFDDVVSGLDIAREVRTLNVQHSELLPLLRLRASTTLSLNELERAIRFATFLKHWSSQLVVQGEGAAMMLVDAAEPEAVELETTESNEATKSDAVASDEMVMPDKLESTAISPTLVVEAARVKIISLLDEGYTAGAIAQVIGRTPQWVGRASSTKVRGSIDIAMAQKINEMNWDEVLAPISVADSSNEEATEVKEEV